MTYVHRPPEPQATGSNPVGRTNQGLDSEERTRISLQSTLQFRLHDDATVHDYKTSERCPAASEAAGHRFESCRAYHPHGAGWRVLALLGATWPKGGPGPRGSGNRALWPRNAKSCHRRTTVAAIGAAIETAGVRATHGPTRPVPRRRPQ